jgi:hypothetical protein
MPCPYNCPQGRVFETRSYKNIQDSTFGNNAIRLSLNNSVLMTHF